MSKTFDRINIYRWIVQHLLIRPMYIRPRLQIVVDGTTIEPMQFVASHHHSILLANLVLNPLFLVPINNQVEPKSCMLAYVEYNRIKVHLQCSRFHTNANRYSHDSSSYHAYLDRWFDHEKNLKYYVDEWMNERESINQLPKAMYGFCGI